MSASSSGCPITPVVDLVFSKWTTPILWQLADRGPLRFGDLRASSGDVTAKVLTSRLRQLARDGLVRRTPSGGVPRRVDYEITDLGRTLAPVFAELARWSEHHLTEVETARRAYDRTHGADPELVRLAARLSTDYKQRSG